MKNSRFSCRIQVLFHVLLKTLHFADIYARRRFMFTLLRHSELLMPFLCRKKSFSSYCQGRDIFRDFVSSFFITSSIIDSASDFISKICFKIFWISFQFVWKKNSFEAFDLLLGAFNVTLTKLTWAIFNPCVTSQQTLWCWKQLRTKTYPQMLSCWLWKSSAGNRGWVHVARWCFLVSSEREN
jgi:hypothetical protein